jgi:hypothetical protein
VIEVETMNNAGKFRQIDACRIATGCTAALEVGTYYGDMTARLATVFEEVITIELDPVLAGKADVSLRGLGNVRVIVGDGLARLPEALRELAGNRVLVYLDGHFSGGETACGDLPEPAVAELSMLLAHVGELGAVVVDDFRCFGTEPGFPKKSWLLRAAELFEYHGFRVLVQNDQTLIVKEAPCSQ